MLLGLVWLIAATLSACGSSDVTAARDATVTGKVETLMTYTDDYVTPECRPELEVQVQDGGGKVLQVADTAAPQPDEQADKNQPTVLTMTCSYSYTAKVPEAGVYKVAVPKLAGRAYGTPEKAVNNSGDETKVPTMKFSFKQYRPTGG